MSCILILRQLAPVPSLCWSIALKPVLHGHVPAGIVVLCCSRVRERNLYAWLVNCWRSLSTEDVAWYSDKVPDGRRDCYAAAAFSLLGNEIDALVFDAWSGFDPDAFGALSGSLKAGGMLILLLPDLESWAVYEDPQKQRITVFPYEARDVGGRFLQRLVRLVGDDRYSLLVEDGCVTRLPLMTDRPAVVVEQKLTDTACETLDQQQAVEAIIRVANGHSRRPVVLVSDRGRGKSAAFGIAAARLLQQGKNRIVVTAPRRDAAETTLRHANCLIPESAGAAEFHCAG